MEVVLYLSKILLRELNSLRNSNMNIEHATHEESIRRVKATVQSALNFHSHIFAASVHIHSACQQRSTQIHVCLLSMARIQSTNAWKTDDENKINKLQSQQKIKSSATLICSSQKLFHEQRAFSAREILRC